MADLRESLQRALGEDYRVQRELAGGGIARVFVADEPAAGGKVAVKVLPFSIAGSAAIARFNRELEVTARLVHPNIVPVLKADQSDDLLYYIMPFAGDSTLRSLMDARRQLPLDEVLRIASEAASALAFAHGHNVVHRDIKPENILLDGGHALVADFGIARAIERVATATSVTTTGLTLGTPRYMSPEQAAASRDIDGRSDIYSLACVVFEMLAGEPPFVSADPRALVAKHLNEHPPSVLSSRPDLPAHIDLTLTKGLAKSPADRFETADAFAAALLDPQLTADLVRTPVGTRRARRRGAPWWMVAVAGLALAAVGALAMLNRPAAPFVGEAMRVAVMNFEPDTPDSALSVFGRAITADLIDVVRRAPEFVPLTREVIRNLRPGVALDWLRDSLNVRRVVTGQLEARDDSIEVTVRIIDAESLTELGREPIRVRFVTTEPMRMRDAVIQEVGRRLMEQFGREAQVRAWRAGTNSAQAWELRQRAQDLVNHAGDALDPRSGFAPQLAALAHADSLLQLASAADPQWSEPYVARGWIQYRRTFYEGISTAAIAYVAAESLADEALARQADDAAALELRGRVRLERWRTVQSSPGSLRDSAEADLRAAIRVERERARAWLSLASLLTTRGDRAEAAYADSMAFVSDPYSRNLNAAVRLAVDRHLRDRRTDSAQAACGRARAMFPDDAVVRMCTLNVLGWAGSGARDLALARAELAWHEQAGPIPLTAGMYVVGRFWIAAIHARSGARDSARAVVQATRARLRAEGFADTALVNEAQVLAELRDHDAAVSLLERYLVLNPHHRDAVVSHPWFDALRSERRFLQLPGGR